MAMDLEKMLERCHKGQWNVGDFDWSKKPISLSKEKEIKVCSYYANMEYIERLAGALFLSLSKRFEDPTLRGIYETFVADEIRHSHAAARLMDYFDVHHYQIYSPSSFLLRFMPYFTRAIESLNPAFANAYILGGELVLDIALLRSLNEYVDDPLSQAVVEKINQDESRHLAMDYFMAEYCSKNRMNRLQGDKKSWRNPDFWGVMVWGPPFFRDVFFQPMQDMDPSNRQMTEVMKRMRRFNDRSEVQNNPTVKNWQETVKFFESPLGARFGEFLEKTVKWTMGLDFSFVRAASTDNVYGKKAPAQPDEVEVQFSKALEAN